MNPERLGGLVSRINSIDAGIKAVHGDRVAAVAKICFYSLLSTGLAREAALTAGKMADATPEQQKAAEDAFFTLHGHLMGAVSELTQVNAKEVLAAAENYHQLISEVMK